MTPAAKHWIPRILIAAVAVVVFLVLRPQPHLTAPHLLTTALIGQNGGCTVSQTLRAMDNTRAIHSELNRVRTTSKRIDTDGTMELWDTPLGNIWYDREFGELSMLVQAEALVSMYGDEAAGVQPGDVVLDCGADHGTFTRTALNRGAKLVVAIEIAPNKLPVLQRTFAREIEAGQVILVGKGVWNEDAVLELSGDSVVFENGETSVAAEVTTIDKIVAELGLEQVDFIKFDIEGAEEQALIGAKDTLQRFRPRLAIAAEHKPDDMTRLPEVVQAMAPDYAPSRGPCFLLGSFDVKAETLMLNAPRPEARLASTRIDSDN